jgi:hypothetical protein
MVPAPVPLLRTCIGSDAAPELFTVALIDPVTARALPLNVKLAESASKPPVEAKVTRPEVRPESVKDVTVTAANESDPATVTAPPK